MSKKLIVALWTGAALIVSANTAVAATLLSDATTEPRDMTAVWGDIRIDDIVFVQPARGPFDIGSSTGRTAGFTATLSDGFGFGDVTVKPFASLIYAGAHDGPMSDPGSAYAAQDSLAGAIGVQTSALFESAMGPLEALIDLYLAQEMDIDGVRLRTLPGALRRNIRSETVDAANFDFDNALSLRIKGIVPGYFHYETRVRVRSTGLQEISGGIRFRW